MATAAANGYSKLTKAQLTEALELARLETTHLSDSNEMFASNYELVQEQIGELELQMEDIGWRKLMSDSEFEFSRSALYQIVRMARIFFLKNPLIKHGVNVQADYIFGQGINISADDPVVNDVVQTFLDDKRNLRVFSSHAARVENEQALQYDSNLFWVLVTDPKKGRVQIRSIPVEEFIAGDIIRNPDDQAEVWYYKRKWTSITLDVAEGTEVSEERIDIYPDYAYTPLKQPARVGDAEVHWDQPIYHVKVGGLKGWKFGLPEVYSALAWAKQVVDDLSDYATVKHALARFAMKITTAGGRSQREAAKAQLKTGMSLGQLRETNPPNVAGGAWIETKDVANMEVFRTAGAQPSPEEGRRLWYMVSAGTGIPEPILAGDATLGTYATAKTLDRPTELMMTNRQQLWSDVFRDILAYVIDASVRSTEGLLSNPQGVTRDELGDLVVVLPFEDEVQNAEFTEASLPPPTPPKAAPTTVGQVDPATSKPGESDADRLKAELDGKMPSVPNDPVKPKPRDRNVNVEFPPILERDKLAEVQAITAAAAAANGGKTMPDTLLARLMLRTLGIENIDEVLAELEAEATQKKLNTPPQLAPFTGIPPGQPGGPPPGTPVLGAPPGTPGGPPAAIPVAGAPTAALTAALAPTTLGEALRHVKRGLTMLSEYSEDQERDDAGRFGSGGGGGSDSGGGSSDPDQRGSYGTVNRDDVHATWSGDRIGVSTEDKYKVDGKWDPERVAAVHDPILKGLTEGVQKSAFPTLYMTGGGYGSGKSSMLESGQTGFPAGGEAADKAGVAREAVIVDPDAMKGAIPEFVAGAARGDPMAATQAHEESSYLAKEGVRESLAAGYNVVYDTSGDSGGALLAEKVASFREAGATRVEASYATPGSIEEAVNRTDARAERSEGSRRYVPHSLVEANHINVAQSWVYSAEHATFDKLSLYSTAGPMGSTPPLIASAENGVITVHDQAAFDAFANPERLPREGPDTIPLWKP